MQIKDELKQKALQAASAEEIKKLAEEYDITLSDEEAEKYFVLTRNGELSDEELDIVAGGKGKPDPQPKYKAGMHMWLGYPSTQTYEEIEIIQPEFYDPPDGWRYLVLPVGKFLQTHEWLETREYVHTSDPGPGWHD